MDRLEFRLDQKFSIADKLAITASIADNINNFEEIFDLFRKRILEHTPEYPDHRTKMLLATVSGIIEGLIDELEKSGAIIVMEKDSIIAALQPLALAAVHYRLEDYFQCKRAKEKENDA
jgi:hypothetical protein